MTEVDIEKIILGIFPVKDLPDTNKLVIKNQNGDVLGWLGNKGNVVLKGPLNAPHDEFRHIAYSKGIEQMHSFISSLLFHQTSQSPKIIKKPSGQLFNFMTERSSAITGNVIIEVEPPEN